MANIKPLVDYLKINRRAKEATAKETNTIVQVLDQHYNEFNATTEIEVPKVEINDGSNYIPLSVRMSFNQEDSIYVEVINDDDEPNSIRYYEKRIFNEASGEVIKYNRFGNLNFEVVDDSDFVAIPLSNHRSVYYYNNTTNRIVISNSLDTVYVFPDVFSYDPNDISDIENGTYKLDYEDHEGYDNGVFDQSLKLALDSVFKNYLDGRKRKIDVSLVTNAEAKGRVYLFPLISTEKGKYKLRYVYEKEDETLFGVKYNSSAITLKFNYLGAFLEFLNQTVFYDGDFDALTGEKGIRQKFLSDYATHINSELNFVRYDIDKTLEILFYTPKIFLKQVDVNVLWDIVGEALRDNLTNIGTNREDVVLRLLEALYKQSRTPYIFLTELLIRKVNKKKSYFYALFNKMNTDNFVKYNDFLKAIWLESSYVNLDNITYEEKVTGTEDLVYDGPLILPYKSDKTLGIYHSNTDIDWKDSYTKFNVELETGTYKYVGARKRRKEITVNYTYHPFQPIYIKNVDDQKTELKLDNIMPAFYLKAVEAKKTVSNVYTSLEYTADVLTTLSGVGNIAKFRHLSKLSKLAKVTKGVKNADKVARSARILARVKLVAGVVEVTSGTVNVLIKLSGTDSEFAKSLQKYLFYLEMLTLTGELTVAIKGGLKKYAREALAQSDEAIKKAHPEIFKHLDEIAGSSLKVLEKNKDYKKHLDDLKSGKVKRVFKDVLSIEEEAVLKFYTTNGGYKNFNRALRGEESMTDFFRVQESLMNQALDKLPNYKSDELLYRIENLTESQVNNIYKEGNVVVNKHFTSSTYSYKSVRDAVWSRNYTVMIRIKGKDGKLIEGLSTLKKEREVLFKSNTAFYVEKIAFTIDPIDPDDYTKFIKEITLIQK